MKRKIFVDKLKYSYIQTLANIKNYAEFYLFDAALIEGIMQLYLNENVVNQNLKR